MKILVFYCILGVILLLNVAYGQEEIEPRKDKKNIQTAIQLLLGQVCLCRCGVPNFFIQEYRDAVSMAEDEKNANNSSMKLVKDDPNTFNDTIYVQNDKVVEGVIFADYSKNGSANNVGDAILSTVDSKNISANNTEFEDKVLLSKVDSKNISANNIEFEDGVLSTMDNKNISANNIEFEDGVLSTMDNKNISANNIEFGDEILSAVSNKNISANNVEFESGKLSAMDSKNISESNVEFESGILSAEDSKNGIPEAKLVGGDNLYENGFPWLVLLIIKGVPLAGGAVITDRHVITAASPLLALSPAEVKISIGAHDRCMPEAQSWNVSVTSITLHPSFILTNNRHDIAILTLSSKIIFNRVVSPICLPESSDTNIHQTHWIASWLYPVAPSPLVPRPPPNCIPKVVRLPTLSYDECLRASSNPIQLTFEKYCLGPFGARSQICSGDVGSPIQFINKKGQFELSGILMDVNMCDTKQPVVFTRVDQHITWIKNIIKTGCLCNT